MKGKIQFANHVITDVKNVSRNGENVIASNLNCMDFIFGGKLLKLNSKIQFDLFLLKDVISPSKTSFFMSFTLLI
jgi:hypothetical protein